MVLRARVLCLSALLVLPLLTVGCATHPARWSSGGDTDGEIYRESSADVVNRAPAAMALPQATSGPGTLSPKDQRQTAGELVDDLYLRTQADYHFTLAESHSLDGEAQRAIEGYKLTLVYDPKSPVVHLRLAAEYVKQGLVSEAIEQAKTALEHDPKFEDAYLLLGGLYSALRMYDDALKQYRTVIKLNPENTEAPMFIGALLAEQKKFAEAADYFERLAKSPDNPQAHLAWYYLGRVRLEENPKKNTPRAESAFRESLISKPSYTDALLALGQLLEGSGRLPQAQQLYQGFQEKHGPSEDVAQELARLYLQAKDYNRAFEQLALVEAADSADINVKAKMAFILIEQQRYPEAILRLEEVLSLEPSSDKARFYLGAIYEETKDYRSAIAQFKKVPPVSSYYKESVVHAAYLHKLLGEIDSGIAAIEEGLKAVDDHPQFYALYASLLDESRQYNKAVTMLADAVERFPNHAELHFYLGNMQDRTGDKDRALVTMKRVLSLDADHVAALNFIAYSYAETGQNLEEAERMIRKAIELSPSDGYILDTLGWVLFKRGKGAEAVRVLEAALKLQPSESVIAEHLGDAYYLMQMPDRAKKFYQRAAENESNVAQVEKIRAKIVSIDRQIQQTKALSAEDTARRPASLGSP
jgi:tetratricopeptide (TPR) repeat protein